MAHITIMNDCLKGNHKECPGGISPPEGYIGGTICNCPCHKSDIMHPENKLMNMSNHLDAISVATLGIERKTAEHKGLWAVILKLVPFKDGDHWCVLYGDDIQSGIVGFGKSPIEAMYDFDQGMREPLKKGFDPFEEILKCP
jgi:hypothetical protein